MRPQQRSIRPSSITFPKFGFADVSEEERKEIEKKVAPPIKAAFLADSWFLTLTGGKPVGGDAFTLDWFEDDIDEPFSLDCRAKHDWAIYRVDGRLRFTRTTPNSNSSQRRWIPGLLAQH
jgi:hypothetical protein